MPSPSACRDLPPLITALCDPGFHRPRAAEVELLQTHISYIVLAGDRAYKIKKPVRFSFLDFSSLDRRRFFCGEEVRLNRRLAPEVYLGVTGVRRDGEGFRFCDADDPGAEEVAVVMRRLPSHRILAHLIESGQAQSHHIDSILRKLLSFYEGNRLEAGAAGAAAPARVLEWMDQDFAEMDRFRGNIIEAEDDDSIRRFCLETTRRLSSLLEQRRLRGRVCDGHGDLHCENICLADEGVVIFDCIEFNPDFRQRDVASDIAFLAMDLEYRGRPEFARQLVDGFAKASADPVLPRLVPLFACHRAYIRGKVDTLKSLGKELLESERELARVQAAAHFALALRMTWSYSIGLVLVTGLSGTGKSTVSAQLRSRTGAVSFSSDLIRKELAGLTPITRVTAADRERLYSPEMSRQTYATMLERAGCQLAAGRLVILDATFLREEYRREACTLAATHRVPMIVVECVASPCEVEERLQVRWQANQDPSDADVAVYRRQSEVYQPPAAEEGFAVVRIDTTRPRAEWLAEVESLLRRQLPPVIRV